MTTTGIFGDGENCNGDAVEAFTLAIREAVDIVAKQIGGQYRHEAYRALIGCAAVYTVPVAMLHDGLGKDEITQTMTDDLSFFIERTYEKIAPSGRVLS
jgi:hypothetical protein